MAYEYGFEEASRRHYEDGVALSTRKRFDNAGYHFGFAAECAIKRLLQTMGVPDGDEAQWGHFPELRQLALQAVNGRSASELRSMLGRANYMQRWDTKMRYARNGSISQETVDRWRADADEAAGLLISHVR